MYDELLLQIDTESKKSISDHTIFFVDDDDTHLFLYKEMAKNALPCKIETFSDPTEAVSKVKDMNGLAVIVSDYNMPGMNGIEVLTAVKEHDPSITRIMISGYSPIQSYLKHNGLAHFYLGKPYASKDLKRTLKDAFDLYVFNKLLISKRV